MAFSKSFTLLTLSLILSACGGGGGSSTPSKNTDAGTVVTPATLTLESSQMPEFLVENDSGEFTFTLQGIEGTLSPTVEYDYLPEGSSVEASVNGSEVVITLFLADEKMSNSFSNIIVSIEDQRTTANQMVAWEGTLLIKNISGDAEYERLTSIERAAQNYVQLSEERLLVERLGKLATIVSPSFMHVHQSELVQRIDEIVSDEEYQLLFGDAMKLLKSLTSQYINGEVEETELNQIFPLLDAAIDLYGSAAYAVIQDVIKASAGEVDEYEYQGAILNSIASKYSSFIGNSSLGEYVNDNWVFNSRHIYLEPIANPELTNCSAE